MEEELSEAGGVRLGGRCGAHPTTAGPTVPALTTVTPDAWLRPLALLLDGLRTKSAAPRLPAPALTFDQLGKVLLKLGPHRRR